MNEKNLGKQYWENDLKCARFVVAPMVDQSELAWRMLCRRHGAQLCYTPMFHASNFVRDAVYRKDNFQTCSEDRPLIVQFCANNAEILVKACKLVESECDGVDLNLGCPQTIAKRGHYGSFLQDEWNLIANLVRSVHQNVSIPISCKVRIFESMEKTVAYAKMLEASGCQLLTVHGRTREQKGRFTGIADWKYVKAIKEAVNIPVFSNGNIQYFDDVQRCLQETGVDGVMTAEGNLHNPFIFEERKFPAPCWEAALEYLSLAEQYPCPFSFMRGHLFKLFHHSFLQFVDLRDKLAAAESIDGLKFVCLELKERCATVHENFINNTCVYTKENLPHWVCQPYERPIFDQSKSSNEVLSEKGENSSIAGEFSIKKRRRAEIEKLAEEAGLSRKKAKRLVLHPERKPNEKPRRVCIICDCGNPLSAKCVFKKCKKCCRVKLLNEQVDCEVHRFHKPIVIGT